MFIKTFLSNKNNIALMRDAGYELSPFMDKTDKHHIQFLRQETNDLFSELAFSKCGTDQVDVSIFISSLFVTRFLDEFAMLPSSIARNIARPKCVLVGDLAWLRGNKKPEDWRKGKSPYFCRKNDDLLLILDDFRIYGSEFITEMTKEGVLAYWLENLNLYPEKINSPYRLISSDRFLYAALIHLRDGNLLQSRKALDVGLAEYEAAAAIAPWRQTVFEEFMVSRNIVISELARREQAGKI